MAQIHELNTFAGTLGAGAYLAIDDGTDTGKISSQSLLAATEARIDNIIAGPAPSAEEIVDARLGADGVTYPSLGDAIRDQITDVKSAISDLEDTTFFKNLFDKNVYYAGKERSASTGELIDSGASVASSDIIPVKKGETVYFTADGASYTPYFIYVWNADGNFSLRKNGSSSLEITSTMSAISICFALAKVNTLQMAYSSDTSYEPYGEIPRTAYNLAVQNASDIADADDRLDVLYGTLPTNPLAVIKETAGYAACFLKVGCIGDSLASGLVSAQDPADTSIKSYLHLYEYSWGQFMARLTGNEYYNFSRGGLNTRTWLASEYATQCFDGEHNCTAYIIGLGQNDYNDSIPIGTIADIHDDDYTLNADTFYGNYGKIIQRLKELSIVKPKIFVVTDPLEHMETSGYNTAIRNIANHFQNVWLIDMYTYGKDIFTSAPSTYWKRDAHYNGMAYLRCAYMMMTYIDWIVRTNADWFKNVELIDTPYRYYSTEIV